MKSRLGPGSLSSEVWKNKPCVLDSLSGARWSDPKLSYLLNMSVCLDAVLLPDPWGERAQQGGLEDPMVVLTPWAWGRAGGPRVRGIS